MKNYWFLTFALVFLASCGGNDGPLTNAELELIEDEIIEAIKKGKLPVYSDNALKNQIEYSEIESLIPVDSAGRKDIAGFGVLTEEEMALYNGDFDNTSTGLAAIGVYVLYSGQNYEQIVPICLLKWDDVAKTLKGSQQKRFTSHMVSHFQNKIIEYQDEIKRLRLEVVNEALFSYLNNGSLTAYENDNLSSVKSPGELETYMAHKVEQMVPDPNDTNETILKFEDVPISAQDITHYLPAYDEDENIVAATMMINENIQGFNINLPWVALDMVEVKELLNESMMSFLQKHLENSEESEAPAIDSTGTDTLEASA